MNYPEWVMKQKRPGTTVKKIGKHYYLYYATSRYSKEKPYPVSVQTYIGKITPEGIVSDRVSIDVGKTQATTLKQLMPHGLPEDLKDVIVLKIKGEWQYTRLSAEELEELKRRGLYEDGKVIVRNF